MKSYQYKCFYFDALGGSDNVEKFVNKHAADGWEYVDGLPSPITAYDRRDPMSVLFRRVFDSNERISRLLKALQELEGQRTVLEQKNKKLLERLEQIDMLAGSE